VADGWLDLIGRCDARPWWWQAGVAGLLVLISAAVQIGLLAPHGLQPAYLLFIPAVAIAALLGGSIAGLTAAALAAAVGHLWLAPIGEAEGWTGLIAFLTGSVLIVATTQALRASHARLIETERNGARERLLRDFVDRLPASAAMFDRDMRYVAASGRWMAAYQLDAGILGRSLYEVFPDLPERWKQVHRRALAGEVVRGDDDCVDRADGSQRWLNWEVVPWFDGRGAVGGITIYSEDLTEQKLMEDRLTQAQQLETVGRLSGGIAHDFNNLLTVILGNADVLRERLGSHSDLQRLAQHICSAGDRAAELTQHLLAFGRQQILKPSAVDLARLVQSSVKHACAKMPPGIVIEIAEEAALPPVFADPLQLEAAIISILSNAQQALTDGGRITLSTGVVMFGDRQNEVAPGHYGMIRISDTGVGMSERVRSRAFEPFFTTKEFGTSSGLGLSMVYGFAKQSDGHVSIDSQLGIGTTVRLYLPLAAPVTAAQLAPQDIRHVA